LKGLFNWLLRLLDYVQVKIHWISGVEPGRLGIMPRPRGGDWLEDEIQSLKRSGVEAVVSLLERQEIIELDIAEEQVLCEANGIFLFIVITLRLCRSPQPRLPIATCCV